MQIFLTSHTRATPHHILLMTDQSDYSSATMHCNRTIKKIFISCSQTLSLHFVIIRDQLHLEPWIMLYVPMKEFKSLYFSES